MIQQGLLFHRLQDVNLHESCGNNKSICSRICIKYMGKRISIDIGIWKDTVTELNVKGRTLMQTNPWLRGGGKCFNHKP